jgi:phosphoglycerate dehydrogenase-like enzyme
MDDPAYGVPVINTSRGAIVDEQALLETLRARTIAGAAVDVFDTEPLPAKHPFRSLENLLATPRIGFGAEDLYRTFYGDAAAAIGAWIEKAREHQKERGVTAANPS